MIQNRDGDAFNGIRSTVLGGRIVSTANSTSKNRTYVFAGESVLAIQLKNANTAAGVYEDTVYFAHYDPAEETAVWTRPDGVKITKENSYNYYDNEFFQSEADPMGANVGLKDPYWQPPDPDIMLPPMTNPYMDPGYGIRNNPQEPLMILDGVPVSYSWFAGRLRNREFDLLAYHHSRVGKPIFRKAKETGVFIGYFTRPFNYADYFITEDNASQPNTRKLKFRDAAGVRSFLSNALQGECRNAIRVFIEELEKSSGVQARSKDLLEVFDELARQEVGGVRFDVEGDLYAELNQDLNRDFPGILPSFENQGVIALGLSYRVPDGITIKGTRLNGEGYLYISGTGYSTQERRFIATNIYTAANFQLVKLIHELLHLSATGGKTTTMPTIQHNLTLGRQPMPLVVRVWKNTLRNTAGRDRRRKKQ